VKRLLTEKDAWVAEHDLQNKTSAFAYSDEGLAVGLRDLGVQVEELALPSKSNYPI
jgi:hypothetical protein